VDFALRTQRQLWNAPTLVGGCVPAWRQYGDDAELFALIVVLPQTRVVAAVWSSLRERLVWTGGHRKTCPAESEARALQLARCKRLTHWLSPC
jgi:hypothetical protein